MGDPDAFGCGRYPAKEIVERRRVRALIVAHFAEDTCEDDYTDDLMISAIVRDILNMME
jgi:hypothetical protein